MRQFFKNPVTLLLIGLMAANALLSGRYASVSDFLWSTLLIIPGILIGLAMHEFAHAKVANLLGDPTPKLQGRVTINPFAHVDPVGLLALLFIGFGWGKPVQINPNNFKHRRRDSFLVSVAGVTMNLILAFLFTGLMLVLLKYHYSFFISQYGATVQLILANIVQINLVLMVFNLLPVPPLDGFNMISELFNLTGRPIWYRIYNMGFPILMILILLGVTSRILWPATQSTARLLSKFWLTVLGLM